MSPCSTKVSIHPSSASPGDGVVESVMRGIVGAAVGVLRNLGLEHR